MKEKWGTPCTLPRLTSGPAPLVHHELGSRSLWLTILDKNNLFFPLKLEKQCIMFAFG